MLQPSLSGDARKSVICTVNSDPSVGTESTSPLLFAQGVKKIHVSTSSLYAPKLIVKCLCATKKEVIDTGALVEMYRKEIKELKRRLDEREREGPVRNRLSAREVTCDRVTGCLDG